MIISTNKYAINSAKQQFTSNHSIKKIYKHLSHVIESKPKSIYNSTKVHLDLKRLKSSVPLSASLSC